MKAVERVEKFNEFKRMHQTGQLRSHQIVSKLGISKNTLYNWRKKLKTEIATTKPGFSWEKSTSSLFTRIISQGALAQPTPHFIEITIGNSIVVRLPETMQIQSLQQIFAMITQWNSR